jgi:hypothetical protein
MNYIKQLGRAERIQELREYLASAKVQLRPGGRQPHRLDRNQGRLAVVAVHRRTR